MDRTLARRIDDAIARLVEYDLVTPDEVVGLPSAEIDDLEDHSGVSFPAAYRYFLRRAGESCGQFLRGSSLGPPDALTEGLADCLDAEDTAFELTDDHVAFLAHHGYVYLFFDATDGPNPPVWRYVEGDAPQEVTGSFTGWLHWTVEDEITLTLDQ